MSYVHFLDIFDPAGLPPGLSDHDAAEQARSLRLTTPSQRLLALLTRIRQQPPGITVNVVGGQDQQPVEWVAGEPPRVEGDGAHYALWTLILPVDEDYDTEELEDVAPQIEAWAKELGLRVFDEAQEAFAPPEPASPQPASAAPVHPATSGDQVVSIYLNHFIWAPYFKQGGRQLGLGLEEIGDELMLMEQFPEPGLADRCLAWRGRLIHRLMQQLPWQTHGNALWVDGDPALRHRQWGGPGFELRVPANRLDEVMRVLMPLVRQLNAHVMVPSRQFWFTFWNSVSPGAETQLNDWDPAWQTPPMKDKPRRALVIAGLKSRLEPLGFALEEGPEASYWFMRPLRPGGGYQIVRAYVGFRLQLNVTSARYLRIQQQRGGGLENPTSNGFSPGGVVVSQDMERVSTYPFDTIAYEEDAAWYFEEFERLFLPALEHLHTARDLYEWYWDERWKPLNCNQGSMYSIYAARYLPDAGFLPIVDQFLVDVPKGPMNEFAQLMRTQPRFSDELL